MTRITSKKSETGDSWLEDDNDSTSTSSPDIRGKYCKPCITDNMTGCKMHKEFEAQIHEWPTDKLFCLQHSSWKQQKITSFLAKRQSFMSSSITTTIECTQHMEHCKAGMKEEQENRGDRQAGLTKRQKDKTNVLPVVSSFVSNHVTEQEERDTWRLCVTEGANRVKLPFAYIFFRSLVVFVVSISGLTKTRQQCFESLLNFSDRQDVCKIL